MENIIEIRHLHKSFGEVHAVDDLSFRVKEGELFAFLGVNGAGKSTTINMLCGQLKKDAGEIMIDGKDQEREMDAIRESLGVVFQNSVLDKQLTVYDNLKSRAALYGICGKEFAQRLAELDALLGLKSLLKRALGKLSGGQRRRVDIARAILHKPKILILDEPTTGLDPQTRQTVWGVVESLRKNENMTVFLTTHYMEEAAKADHIGIMSHGHFVEYGTPFSLKETYAKDKLYLIPADQRQSLPGEKRAVKRVSVKPKSAADCREEIKKCLDGRHFEYTIREEGILVKIDSTLDALPLLQEMRGMLQGFEVIQGTMDDVFLNVTKKMDDVFLNVTKKMDDVFVQDAKEDENEKVC